MRASIDVDNVSDSCYLLKLVLEGDLQVLHLLRSLVRPGINQIDMLQVRFHELVGDFAHPRGNRSREQEKLHLIEVPPAFLVVSLGGVQDFFNIFLESKVQHLICFVQNKGLYLTHF